MYIQCTQKLLAKLDQPHEKLTNPPDSKYCWHASFFEHFGMVFVAIVNDCSGHELFVEVDSYQNFSSGLLQELERDMIDLGLSNEEVSSYFTHAGPLMFGPTGERAQIARLNGFTRRLKDFAVNTISFLEEMQAKAEKEGVPLDFDELEQNSLSYKGNPKPKLSPAK
jgi:hypothetical protein